MRPDLLHEFVNQTEVEYKGEKYLVRDNGAVCRKSRPGARRRQLDDVWTFGRPDNSKGYMNVGEHVVHRIVACAFHPQPSDKHVVDHIDTNRRNNRAENLRWVTRLENVLLNPITLARVIQGYGSLEAFFANPSRHDSLDPNYNWMRTVSKAEADESRRRLIKWAESGQTPTDGHLGEWLFGTESPRSKRANDVHVLGPPRRVSTRQEWPTPNEAEDDGEDIESLTPLAVQRNWATLTEFPACPHAIGSSPLREYLDRLKVGDVFCVNRFGKGLVEVAGENGSLLCVLSQMPQPAVKDWALARIWVENGKFVHESGGTYFSLGGARNVYNKSLGIDAPHEETIDDYC